MLKKRTELNRRKNNKTKKNINGSSGSSGSSNSKKYQPDRVLNRLYHNARMVNPTEIDFTKINNKVENKKLKDLLALKDSGIAFKKNIYTQKLKPLINTQNVSEYNENDCKKEKNELNMALKKIEKLKKKLDSINLARVKEIQKMLDSNSSEEFNKYSKNIRQNISDNVDALSNEAILNQEKELLNKRE